MYILIMILGTRNGCDTHFSDGEVIVEDGVVSIMMQEAGDSGANMVTPQFECRVDGAHRYSPCKLLTDT